MNQEIRKRGALYVNYCNVKVVAKLTNPYQSREPFCADALGIFLAVANNQAGGFLTVESATDIYYLTHRHTHSDKDTRAILNALFQLFDLLDTAGMDCRRTTGGTAFFVVISLVI